MSDVLNRSAYERVLGVGLRLAATDDLDAVLGEVVDAMRDVLGAERASVFTLDGETGDFVASRAHGLDPAFRVAGDEGVIGRAARTKRVINVEDASSEREFTGAVDARTGFETRCLLAVPMVDASGGLVGVVQVLNKREGKFDDGDELVATHLAAQAGVAIRRAGLVEAARRRDALEAEISAARAMQRAAMPTELPAVGGWSVDAAWSPAMGDNGAAGDSYDAFVSDDGSRLIVMLADASGHGVGPAVSVSRMQAMLRMGVRCGVPLGEVVREVNDQLAVDLPTGHFVTVFVAEAEAGAGVIRFCSAGQAPVGVARGAEVVRTLGATRPPLGIDPRIDSSMDGELELSPGEVLIVGSDGVYESGNGIGVADVAALLEGDGCGGVLSRLPEGEDDRTLLTLRWSGEAARGAGD